MPFYFDSCNLEKWRVGNDLLKHDQMIMIKMKETRRAFRPLLLKVKDEDNFLLEKRGKRKGRMMLRVFGTNQ